MHAVALVTPGLGHGGMERVVRDLAIGLKRRGVIASVLCTTKLGIHADDLARAGISVSLCRDTGLRIRGLPLRLIRRLRRLAPGLVHAHGGAWIHAGIAASLLRLPLVVTAHGRDGTALRALTRWVTRKADRVTAVSSAAALDLRARLELRRQIDVVPNGIDGSGFPPVGAREELRASRGLAASDVLMVAIGRLEPVKGHSLLLDALRRALPRAPRLRLAILGAGSLEGSLRAKSCELGIGHRVNFLGFRRDAAEWLRCADIFAMPSEAEGMPLALLEAMACAVPVIATAVPGIVDVLGSPPAGNIVAPGDAGGLAEAVVRLSSDSTARQSLALAAARRAAAFSLDVTVDRYCEIYREVLA